MSAAARKTSRGEIDWAEIRRRVEAAAHAMEGSAEASPKRARRVLEERARALARPVASPSAGETLELITFGLANEVYALESRFVRSVFRMTDIAPLPAGESPVCGLAAWRGDLLTVLDLRPVLGISSSSLTDLHRVIAVGEQRTGFGILADAVHDLITVPVADVREPGGVAAHREYLRGVTPAAILVLDGERLLRLHAQ